MHGLAEMLSFGEPLKTCLAPKIQWQHAFWVKPTRAAIAPCLMPSLASANTSCLIPIGVGRGIVRTIRKTILKKYANIDSKLSQCEDWFGGTTTYTVVWELDDPTWPYIECLPKVVSDFVGEESWVHIMPISAKWKHKSSIHISFIVFNGGVTTFFAKSVHLSDQQFYCLLNCALY